MSYKRRDFLKTTGQLAAGIAATSVTGNFAWAADLFEEQKRLKAFGIQLYSLRDDMPKDPKGVLKQVAAFGYKQIESYEGSKGMFWGMSNTEFKKYMDDLGMTIVASHCDIFNDFERKANEAAAIGMKYLICPGVPSARRKTLDDYKKISDDFNARGEICKKAGLRFAYHNHDYSFQQVEGKFPQDIMMQNTGKDLVDFQMDIYWVVTAGQDPVEWLKKYPNRFRSSHVKDRKKDVPLTIKDASCDLGTGSIDFPRILKEASRQGMIYFIMEQERYDNTTPLASAKAGAMYLKKIKI